MGEFQDKLVSAVKCLLEKNAVAACRFYCNKIQAQQKAMARSYLECIIVGVNAKLITLDEQLEMAPTSSKTPVNVICDRYLQYLLFETSARTANRTRAARERISEKTSKINDAFEKKTAICYWSRAKAGVSRINGGKQKRNAFHIYARFRWFYKDGWTPRNTRWL